MVVNNNAAAVLLVLAALASGRDVPVSRGESVEIGGAFRVPEVIAQSGARLVDVGTTNRTRVADYAAAIARPGVDAAMILKVHPSNYRVDGFVEETSVEQLASLGVPVVADIGSGLIDADTPWLGGTPPAWLATEPAARQSLAAGADLVTFSGDKLLAGPQAGIIAGDADLVARCAAHPLARALRPGGLVMAALQQVALAYLRRDLDALPFWKMVATPLSELGARAHAIIAAVADTAGPDRAGRLEIIETDAVPGAGSAPGVTVSSVGIALDGDHLGDLRGLDPPIIARVRDHRSIIDLRSVLADDDHLIVAALSGVVAAGASEPDAP
jgi:L-seryl-tRNA(Ser) seleniumtransferase